MVDRPIVWRDFWRRMAPRAVALLVLAGLIGFAWLSRHPEDPRVERAETWPVIGPVVAELRQLYLEPEEPAPPPEEAREVWIPLVPQPEPAAPVVGTGESTTLWVPPGTALRAEADAESRVITTVPTYAEVQVMESRPAARRPGEGRPAHWHLVVHGRESGWLRLVEPQAGEPPLGRAPAPVLPVPGHPPDSRRLELALELLGSQRRSLTLGSYVLYTDVDDPLLVRNLEAVAERLEPAYRRRFGLDLVGEPAEAVVLFDQRDDYRAYQRSWNRLGGLRVAGHAGHGLVAFYRGERRPRELVSTLVHELTHLLNRRALGPALPPWLDEGLAEDLTWAEIDTAGRLRPGSWGGDRVVTATGRELTGGLAVRGRLPLLAETLESGRGVPTRELVELDWEGFVRRNRPLHYQLSGLSVRFLLDDRELSPRFRRFLADTAAGEVLTSQRLTDTLGISFEEVDRRLAAWVRKQGESG